MDDEGRREEKLLEQIEQLKDQLSLQMDSREAMAVTEERYRSLIENAPFPIVVIDRDLKVLSINRLMPGYKEVDVVGKSIFEHIKAEDPELIKTTIERVFKTGEVSDYQMKGPRFDGGTGVYLTTVSPVIQDGEVVAVTSVSMEITKELEANMALKESEERYRMLAGSSFEGIVIHQNGLILDVNSRVTEISGYEREELIGSKFFDLLHPSSKETVVRNVQEDSGSPYEVLAIAKDGSILELEVLGKTIPYKGDIARVACVRDVSERKRQEEALRKSEERYRLVTDNLHDVIWTMDMDLKYTYISASVERQRGFTADEVMQQSIHDVMTPESLEKVFNTVESVLRPILAGETDLHTGVTLELGMYRKDGSVMPAEMSISLLLDPEERPIGIMGVTRDISERTDAEMAVAQSDARYRMFAENVDDIIFTLTPELDIEYVSPSLLKLTGYTFEEVVDMGWQGLFTPDSLETALETISEDVLGAIEPDKAKERSVRMELEILTKRGKKRWIEVNVSLLTTETGEVARMLGVARDVTERKRTQAQFLEEKKRAELYLDLFGHEIRNINQGIMSYLELILMRQGLNPEEV
ncbi:MAG: PAS domain S-box protein, partial [Thermoplasmata archaeon]|nr:PAS domain S-box protein [Thermoplasmata archaeon]